MTNTELILNIIILALVAINIISGIYWGKVEKNALLATIQSKEAEISILKLTQVKEYNKNMEELQKAWTETKKKLNATNDYSLKLRDINNYKTKIIARLERKNNENQLGERETAAKVAHEIFSSLINGVKATETGSQ